MPLRPCPTCGSHVLTDACSCPHCGASVCAREPSKLPAAALLMGLALSGCNILPAPQPKYGVAIDDSATFEDADDDGYAEDVDCDDGNDAIHPDAEETPGDGVDSNCDGEDDT